jgi:MoaA/NifB/PqqE/SkfB family radical SAM enzyme
VADAFSLLNINRFDFIGGEVSKYGDGWLELAKHINIGRNRIVTVFTNGWWLEKVNFNAAGRNYVNDAQYLEDLKSNGVTHILFSIDGDEAYHDKSRKHKGLYRKIISSFERIKQAGIQPRITALIIDKWNIETTRSFADIATRIYNLPDDLDLESKIYRLTHDPTNQFSNFIDIGSGVNLRKNKSKISNISSDSLRCKAFYRPWPSLRIMANGNLSVCPLLDAGEGYGNVHKRNIVEILNDFQNSFAYKLHANKEIKNYLKYLDRTIFGESYDHICSIRVILTLMAKYINSAETLNSETILEINRKIARYAGFEKT